jgi:hypothetical protein
MTRIVILGGPRTGKTTLSKSMSRVHGARPQTVGMDGYVNVSHTDDLIEQCKHLGKDAWSEASRIASTWLDAPGPWIIEGVAMSRALRKWREAHPGERPPVDRVIRLTTPHVELTKGQAAMAMGEATVWAEVEPWLLESGLTIELPHLRPSGPAPAASGPCGSGRRGWMGLGPGEEP